MRGSSPGCRVDKDTLVNPVQQRGQGKSRKGSKYKKVTVVEGEDNMSMYLQQQTSSEAAQPRLALAEDALY
jgi:hypothetical protein